MTLKLFHNFLEDNLLKHTKPLTILLTLWLTVPLPQEIVMDVCQDLATCVLIIAKYVEKPKCQIIEDWLKP